MKIYALFSSSSVNIGDDIQTLAVEQMLGHVDGYIDREKVHSDSSYGVLIANGWWKHREDDFPPHPNITPAYIGIHFRCSDHFLQRNAEHLKSCSPIGCRDPGTLERLRILGIPSYLSNCMTLGLQRWIPEDSSGPVIAVDMPFTHKLPFDVVKMTHNGPLSSHPQTMRELSVMRLEAYQTASLVITGRLHVALPCIALGIPVVFAVSDIQDSRFGAIKDFLPIQKLGQRLSLNGIVLPKGQRDELRRSAQKYLSEAVARASEKHASKVAALNI